ncbi:DMT family transporter [Halanaerobiaceae bacterium Z-7014]|uniref:DMT family transporter n=1 Tax=Halonatronomonas betaini TaxID=2778430 RepID=A0A931ARN4_9FIRM|nr:DMT family transporter [Halonatronomonas betaini]MBF8436611.1 DMT family transporter [Halonatronomonas betaini]
MGKQNKSGDKSQVLPYLAGLTFSIIFGFSFMFSQDALEYLNPFHLLGFRFIIASLTMTFFWGLGFIEINILSKAKGPLLLVALFQPALYFPFEVTGIQMTTSSQAGLMISLIPVAVAIFGAIFLKEIPGKLQLFFIILSVSGVGVIVSFQGELASTEGHLIGLLLLMGAVISAGLYNIVSRSISVNYTPVEITFFMCYTGAIIFNIIGIRLHDGGLSEYISMFTLSEVLIAVTYLGVLSSVVAFFMMNFTLSKLPASQAAIFANLVTVVSIFAGVFLRNEPFYRPQIIGAIMIILGVWGTNYFGVKEKREKKFNRGENYEKNFN